MIGPVDAARGCVNRINETRVDAQEHPPGDYGRLPVDCLSAWEPEGPFQLQLRDLLGFELRRGRLLKARVRQTRAPSVPSWLGRDFAQAGICCAAVRH